MGTPKRKAPLAFKQALNIVLKQGFWVLQKRAKKTGQWQTVGERIQGHQNALDALNLAKANNHLKYEWRIEQEVLAQAYAQGWNDHDAMIRGTYVPYDEVA